MLLRYYLLTHLGRCRYTPPIIWNVGDTEEDPAFAVGSVVPFVPRSGPLTRSLDRHGEKNCRVCKAPDTGR